MQQMDVTAIIAELDGEIGRLQAARKVLVNGTAPMVKQQRRKKRKLSPEGRERIVAALKKRWVAKKKAEK